jgi:predicted metal-dependent phosphotriesterase family hydrolase
MGVVNTVLGRVPTEALGITALHEHVAFGQNGWALESKWWKPASAIIESAERHIGEFMRLGGRTYVDLTGVGMARDIDRFRVIARSTGVNFVACTGFWTGTGVRPYFWDKPVEYFTDFFIKELTVGIDDTGAKAGVIKVGVSVGGLSELDEKLYRAAARAAVATGAPILTHLATSADRQLDLVEAEGLSPDRIVIGHADAGVDVDFERDIRVARRGAYVGLDNIGYDKEKEPSVPWAQNRGDRLRQVLHMLEEGYANRLVVSCDADCVPLGWVSPPQSVAELLDRFLPEMKEAGTDEKTLHQLLVTNPADLLTLRDPKG